MNQCREVRPNLYGARNKAPGGSKPLPPKLRAAAVKNDVRMRRVQEQMKEQRRLETEAAKPGRRRAKASALAAAQRIRDSSRAERAQLFGEVYGHIAPDWIREATVAATVFLVGVAVVCLAGTSGALASKALLDVHTTLSSLAAEVYTSVNAWIMGRAAPLALAFWAAVCAIRAVYLWKSRSVRRQSLLDRPDLCAVCTDRVDAMQEAVVETLVCGHSFHQVCIKPWLVEKHCCFLCHADCASEGME